MRFDFLSTLVFVSFNLTVGIAQHKVAILDDPKESFQIRMSLIRGAKKSLDIATYIYGNDESSSQTLLEVIKAAERGVDVRIVVDALNNKIPKELTAYMLKKGIRIKVFNKFSLKKKLNNVMRMHVKIMISDKLRFIVGGRNIVNSYFYIGDQVNFRDREIYISGIEGKDATQTFDDLWFSALLDELDHGKELSEKKNLNIIKDYFEGLSLMPFLSNDSIVLAIEHMKFNPVDCLKIIMDRPHSFKFTEKRTTDFLLNSIRHSKSSILIESPYVILSKEIFDALEFAIRRGVRVELITNSMMTSDSYLVLPVYYRERDQLLKLGFDIYEFQGEEEYLHTKMFIFDQKELIIGSYNLDMLSANINSEIFISIKNDKVIKESLKYYYDTKRQSISASYNPMKPTLLEGKINLKSIKKYAIIKLLEYTIAPYLRDYL